MKEPETLEGAWQKHEESDLSVVDSLSLELIRLDPQKWRTLQANAAAIKKGEPGPADALLEFAGHLRSSLVLESLIARAYQRANRYDRAIDVAVEALACTPRWDPRLVSVVANTIASSLFHLGELESAVRWAERAVAADPANQFGLGSLCQSYAKVGDARALPIHKLLSEVGFSPSVWEPYDPGPAGKDAKARRLTLDDFEKHGDDDAHRLRIANRFDSNINAANRYRGQALVLAGARRLVPAYLAASIAHDLAQGDDKRQAAIVREGLRRSVDDDAATAVDRGEGRFSRDAETRAQAVGELVEAKDIGAIGDMVFDADYGVSMAACEGWIELGNAEALTPYLELATLLEHKTGQATRSTTTPKPFDLLSGAKRKASATGESLVAAVIAKVKTGECEISIPAPDPVPSAVLEKMVLAEGVPLSPSLRAWLAYDGAWLGREHRWFKNPERPVLAPQPIHVLVYDRISDVFAPSFVELPGKLAGARALPLDEGSDSMRMLALVPGPDGEYPVLFIDVDDDPVIGVEAPGFDVWLASQAEIVGDVRRQYASENKKVGAHLFGGKDSYVELGISGAVAGFGASVKAAKAAGIAEGKRLAQGWKGLAPKRPKGKAAVPELDEPKLGEALSDAIRGGQEERTRAFLEDAKRRFPSGRKWKDAAVGVAAIEGDVDLVRELLDLGADVNASYYLENRLMHAGASRGDLPLTKLLLERGADVEARGFSSQTPLHDACENRQVEAVRLLLAHRVDVEARDEYQATPLMRVAHRGQTSRLELPKCLEIARMLLEAGADVNARNDRTTPLHEAIEETSHELARLLIERGADVTAKDRDGNDAITAAYNANDLPTLDLLRARGVKSSLSIVADDGVTPAVFDVSFRCAEEPQSIHVRARWSPVGMRSRDYSCRLRVSSLFELLAAGMAGSDVFAPTVCRAKVEITQTGASEGATIDWQELECTGTVAGVSPSALAMYVRGLYDVSGHALRELEIRGGLPLDGSRLSIDKARARGWLTDLSAEPYRVWPNLTATITERPARDTYGTIVETADGTAFVQAFVEGFSVVTELWVPPGVTDIRRRFALSRGKTNFRHKTENGTTKLDYWSPMSIPGVANVPPDVVTSRAAFANGVEVLVARKAIESAVWSLGVGGLPPREASSRAKPPTGSGPGAAGGVGSRPRR